MDRGIKLLIKFHREEFRKENKSLYSDPDYRRAERKYIKLCLKGESKD